MSDIYFMDVSTVTSAHNHEKHKVNIWNSGVYRVYDIASVCETDLIVLVARLRPLMFKWVFTFS